MHFLGFVFVAAQFMATLEPKTVSAYDQYLRGVDAQIRARNAGEAPLAGRAAGVFKNDAAEISKGLVQDWTAVAFLPGVKKAQAVPVLEDFSRHASIYPEVVEGRIEKREPGRIYGYHRVRKKKLLEVNLEARYTVDQLPVAANRYASRSVATEIVEIDDAGTKKERRLPPGQDHGFLWRLNTYWTLEETPQGLWMEVRSISLTRDVPPGLGWVVKPLLRDLPKESLEAVMEATRRAVLAAR